MVASERCQVYLAGSLAGSRGSEWERRGREFGMKLAVGRGWMDRAGEHSEPSWAVSLVLAGTTAALCACTVHAPPPASDLLKTRCDSPRDTEGLRLNFR